MVKKSVSKMNNEVIDVCTILKKCNIDDEVIMENQNTEIMNHENKNIDNDKHDETNIDYKSMFVTMMKKNDELQKTIVDMIPKIGSNNTTTTNKVNLNIFLNEHCKVLYQ